MICIKARILPFFAENKLINHSEIYAISFIFLFIEYTGTASWQIQDIPYIMQESRTSHLRSATEKGEKDKLGAFNFDKE